MGITYKKGKTMKTKTPFLFDLLFLFAASFLLVLALSGWIMPRVPGFLTAFAAAGLLTLLCYRVRSKKELAFALRKKDEKEAEALAVQMNFNSLAENLAILERAAQKAEIPFERRKNALFFPAQNKLVCPRFSFDGVSNSEIALAYAERKEDTAAVILSADFSANAKKFAEKFGKKIKLVPIAPLYARLKELDALPPISERFTPKRRSASEWMELIFLKSSSRGYFTAGAMLLILSFIVPYKLYYVISGTVLTLFSLFLRFFGKAPSE